LRHNDKKLRIIERKFIESLKKTVNNLEIDTFLRKNTKKHQIMYHFKFHPKKVVIPTSFIPFHHIELQKITNQLQFDVYASLNLDTSCAIIEQQINSNFVSFIRRSNGKRRRRKLSKFTTARHRWINDR
jgi:hypothetical protein